MSSWVEGRVAFVRSWTDLLFSLGVHAPEVTFEAGQFARLALPAPPGSKEAMLGRPYSFVNPPNTQPHEFYVVLVDGGPLSPRLLYLKPGDPIHLLRNANGFFTIDEVPEADSLWMLATGTGIGPFLSMLRTDAPWERFPRVVLVHAVRHAAELTYREVLSDISRAHPGAFTCISVLSREDHPGALRGRIPALIDNGRLEARAGISLTPQNAQAMLCGNPQMVDDVQDVLKRRGMRRHRRREPGHVHVEAYW
ncbi:MAG TPA: ferredoxin--NADP reductase [Casimicrobiaceae bacterium]|nr:ferredoxin--NADP reductase [Casimicrobiaceae bacterium]